MASKAITLPKQKVRNVFAVLAKQRKAGSHTKPFKATRSKIVNADDY